MNVADLASLRARLVHFIFFVLACVETARRNNASNRLAPVMVMMPPQQPSTAYPPPAGGYYYVPANVVNQMGMQTAWQPYAEQQNMAPMEIPSKPTSPAPVLYR